MKIKLFCWILVFGIGTVQGQNFPSFENKAKTLKKATQTRGLLPGAMIDINGDLIDDVVIIDKGLRYISFLGNDVNRPLHNFPEITFNHYFESFGLAMADLNNDGIIDYVTGGSFGYINVLLSSDSSYLKINLLADFLVQTINLTDINNDGFLDIFVCNDIGPNTIFINVEGISFLPSPQYINFQTIPPSDMSGNYGSVWVDVNNDFKMDLAIAKCRAGASDPTDPRRVNVLYIVDSTGIYKNKAADFGFDLGEQSWAVGFGDFDNDGDMDAYVVNHYDNHTLLENIEGKRFEKRIFYDSTFQLFSFQVITRDFDNDGLLDIALSGLEGISFLHNKGNFQFERINTFVAPMLGMSMLAGDVNDDGFIDIHSQVTEPLNFPGRTDDKLYINEGNQNHFIKFNLQGSISNKSGVGSTIQLFGPWGKQMRQVVSGESYGITTSLLQHFGLGQSTIIDSVKIFWPSGITDIYVDVSPDQTYWVQEGKCMTQTLKIYHEPFILEKDKPLVLEAPEGYMVYQWNNGQTGRMNNVTETGNHFVKMVDSSGCVTLSKPVYVEDGCFTATEDLLGENHSIVACMGEKVVLESIPAKLYQWSTGDSIQQIEILNTGLYSITATDYCGTIKTDSMAIEFVFFADPVIQFPDTVLKGQRIEFSSNLENTIWYAADSITVLARGKKLIIDSASTDITILAASFENVTGQSRAVGIQQFPAINQYGSNTLNGGLRFNVHTELEIQSVKVYSDTPGKRKIVINTAQGTRVFEKEFFVKIGDNTLELNTALPPGNQYSMTTDEVFNFNNLGFNGPRFLRHSGGELSYPYSIENTLDITGSNFGLNYYYYFYDWQVRYGQKTCYSDLQSLSVVVDQMSDVSTVSQSTQKSLIKPNPFIDHFLIQTGFFHDAIFFEVYSSLGQKIVEKTILVPLTRVLTKDWPVGLYYIRICDGLDCATIKGIKPE